MENSKISLRQTSGKCIIRERSTGETTEKEKKKNRKCHTDSDKKATNSGLKLFSGSPKFPYKFKEIISLVLPYVELIM